MEDVVEKLHALLFSNLIMSSPVMSGNMQSMIQTGLEGINTKEIIIDAPFYDIKKWKKEGVIVYAGDKNGISAYAQWVNELGGFATHNKSEHWVNRAIVESVNVVANEIGAVVINEL